MFSLTRPRVITPGGRRSAVVGNPGGADTIARTPSMEVGQAVMLMGVENAGLDISGKRGTVTEVPGHGLVSVTIDDSGDVVSVWPENLKILSSTPAASGDPPSS